MNFPRFFIDRPVFAVVLSVLLLIAGLLALIRLPLSEYPAVTPPTVTVIAAYPGAAPRSSRRRSQARWNRRSTALRA